MTAPSARTSWSKDSRLIRGWSMPCSCQSFASQFPKLLSLSVGARNACVTGWTGKWFWVNISLPLYIREVILPTAFFSHWTEKPRPLTDKDLSSSFTCSAPLLIRSADNNSPCCKQNCSQVTSWPAFAQRASDFNTMLTFSRQSESVFVELLLLPFLFKAFLSDKERKAGKVIVSLSPGATFGNVISPCSFCLPSIVNVHKQRYWDKSIWWFLFVTINCPLLTANWTGAYTFFTSQYFGVVSRSLINRPLKQKAFRFGLSPKSPPYATIMRPSGNSL